MQDNNKQGEEQAGKKNTHYALANGQVEIMQRGD